MACGQRSKSELSHWALGVCPEPLTVVVDLTDSWWEVLGKLGYLKTLAWQEEPCSVQEKHVNPPGQGFECLERFSLQQRNMTFTRPSSFTNYQLFQQELNILHNFVKLVLLINLNCIGQT